MSQRVPLLKAKPTRKPIRGLLVAPKVKTSTSQPTTPANAAAATPNEAQETPSRPAVEAAATTPKNGKGRATGTAAPPRNDSPVRQENLHAASPSTPHERATTRRSGKAASPNPPAIAASPKRIDSKPAPICITVPANSPAPRIIAPPRGIIAPGGSFGLPPPPKPMQISTPSPSRPSPKGVPIASRIAPPSSHKPTTTASPPTKPTTGGIAATQDERSPRANRTTNKKAGNNDDDDDDDSDDAPMLPKSRRTAAKRLLGLPPRSKVARGIPRSRKPAKRYLHEDHHIPVKTQFLAYAAAPHAETRMVKRKTSASRRDLSPPSRESEPEIASMTMGELALSVPFGRRRVDEEEAAHSNDDEDEDNMSRVDAAARRKQDVASRGAATGRPQVEIVNGQIVLSTKSLTVHEDELMQEDDETDGHEPHPRLGRAAGYLSGRSSSRRWNYIETKQFFYCLSHIGTDFTLMETLFPNRTRAELKLKFKSEEKRHRALVEVALEGAKRPLGMMPHTRKRYLMYGWDGW
ncbi:hypothetical protein, variant 1 [Aphanomyces astaci]|uniref:Transcription factor TFIIIB component B'' Myb domain-containing protein n=1 Tax=Aphanomyces astaci TaxID=112090 RepID=W4GQ53_APHAT|nr:hypothetical protein, variant 1 [Aphanomyces astaci]ETV81456.1 hypothetical protein, variant 1 [Aphanomyces astaci]|eukprot:XP_009829315.1 hypothetical protein, variant 1 [Aphanomyces astaci]